MERTSRTCGTQGEAEKREQRGAGKAAAEHWTQQDHTPRTLIDIAAPSPLHVRELTKIGAVIEYPYLYCDLLACSN